MSLHFGMLILQVPRRTVERSHTSAIPASGGVSTHCSSTDTNDSGGPASEQRNMLIVTESLTTKKANTNPRNILPTSPIKTLALGKLKGRNPIQPVAKIILMRNRS